MAIAPGDTVVFATDGVTEAFDAGRAMYGRARLVERLARAPASRPAELVADLEADVARFVRGAPQSDDITVVALTFRGPVGR